MTELQYRDKLILYILGALGIGRIYDITILAGFNEYKYAAKKLKMLEDMKLVASDYLGRCKVYFLTGRGYRECGKSHASYKMNFSSYHDVEVTRIATWLYLTQGISYADLLTDRQMKFLLKGSKIHRPDLVLKDIAYEFEKTAKDQARLKNNMLENRKFKKQVWIVPNDKKFIAERIRKLAKSLLLTNVEIIMMDEIEKYVTEADISQNKMRDKPVLGERNMKILFDKPNSTISKYF